MTKWETSHRSLNIIPEGTYQYCWWYILFQWYSHYITIVITIVIPNSKRLNYQRISSYRIPRPTCPVAPEISSQVAPAEVLCQTPGGAPGHGVFRKWGSRRHGLHQNSHVFLWFFGLDQTLGYGSKFKMIDNMHGLILFSGGIVGYSNKGVALSKNAGYTDTRSKIQDPQFQLEQRETNAMFHTVSDPYFSVPRWKPWFSSPGPLVIPCNFSRGWANEPCVKLKSFISFIYPLLFIMIIYDPPSHSLGGVGGPHFVVNQPLSLQNGSGTQSPSYKMVCL